MFNWIKSFFTERQKLGGKSRSSLWPMIRNNHIKSFPNCAICDKKGSFLRPNEVHHILVFYLHPDQELNPKNFLTLCREHHYEWGHLFCWRSYNKDIIKDVENFRLKVKNRP